jgi:hypothetical protein
VTLYASRESFLHQNPSLAVPLFLLVVIQKKLTNDRREINEGGTIVAITYSYKSFIDLKSVYGYKFKGYKLKDN